MHHCIITAVALCSLCIIGLRRQCLGLVLDGNMFEKKMVSATTIEDFACFDFFSSLEGLLADIRPKFVLLFFSLWTVTQCVHVCKIHVPADSMVLGARRPISATGRLGVNSLRTPQQKCYERCADTTGTV